MSNFYDLKETHDLKNKISAKLKKQIWSLGATSAFATFGTIFIISANVSALTSMSDYKKNIAHLEQENIQARKQIISNSDIAKYVDKDIASTHYLEKNIEQRLLTDSKRLETTFIDKPSPAMLANFVTRYSTELERFYGETPWSLYDQDHGLNLSGTNFARLKSNDSIIDEPYTYPIPDAYINNTIKIPNNNNDIQPNISVSDYLLKEDDALKQDEQAFLNSTNNIPSFSIKRIKDGENINFKDTTIFKNMKNKVLSGLRTQVQKDKESLANFSIFNSVNPDISYRRLNNSNVITSTFTFNSNGDTKKIMKNIAYPHLDDRIVAQARINGDTGDNIQAQIFKKMNSYYDMFHTFPSFYGLKNGNAIDILHTSDSDLKYLYPQTEGNQYENYTDAYYSHKFWSELTGLIESIDVIVVFLLGLLGGWIIHLRKRFKRIFPS